VSEIASSEIASEIAMSEIATFHRGLVGLFNPSQWGGGRVAPLTEPAPCVIERSGQ